MELHAKWGNRYAHVRVCLDIFNACVNKMLIFFSLVQIFCPVLDLCYLDFGPISALTLSQQEFGLVVVLFSPQPCHGLRFGEGRWKNIFFFPFGDRGAAKWEMDVQKLEPGYITCGLDRKSKFDDPTQLGQSFLPFIHRQQLIDIGLNLVLIFHRN